MNEEKQRKRRDWIKNAAIVFLVIMLLLTFFSNTIMNYSLPEVATTYVQSGSITAKVRGTGTVEATDPYNVIVEESRVISSVAVTQGDMVEKDQVIYYLEDAESEELKQARKDLEDLELAYMKGLFGSNVSAEVISKVANGNTDSFAQLQARVTNMQNRLDEAEARVKECTDILNALTLQSTISTNDASVSTVPDEVAQSQAQQDLASAQTAETNAEAAFNNSKAAMTAEINTQIAEKEKQIQDLQTLIDNAETTTGTGDSTTTPGTGSSNDYEADKDTAEKAVVKALNDIIQSAKLDAGYDNSVAETMSSYDSAKVNSAINALKSWISKAGKDNDYQALLAAFYDAKAKLDAVNTQQKEVINHDSNENRLKAAQQELADLKADLASVSAMTYQPGESVQDAQNRLNQAAQNIAEITQTNKLSAAAWQNRIANAQAALDNAKAVYDLLVTERDLMNADINAELDLSKASKDIAEKEEEIARLEEKSVGASITAPVAGMISALTYVAGETIRPDETAAVIQVEGKGYTMTIAITNEQARNVQVGDIAELQNAWWYDDVQLIVSAVKNDPDKPGQGKLLVLDITGSSVQAGQSLNISVGQRSSQYEFVVPNSAVREDSNGKFILIVESKSSPLGNRYMASRVDVTVLAEDDNNTAISGPLYGWEYVITTATQPVEAGKQVRLNENGW